MGLAVQKVCFKKKSSPRMNDYRIKSVVDYILSPMGSKSSMGLLFGELLGLLPRPQPTIRPGNPTT